ncbi:MAG TPA: heparinase II/III family protein, partial [Euzebyales bacterium]|nr:heparinase II/III family protein [Euzebyales bacterium]
MITLARRYARAVWARLRPAPAREEPSTDTVQARPPWELVDPLSLADDLGAVVADPPAAVRTWMERKPPAAMYLHRVEPHARPPQRRRAEELLSGDFRPHTTITPRRETLPPRWDQLPDSSRTEEMYRHSLTWLEPLVSVAYTDGDEDVWRLATDVVTSWITTNSTPPGRSPGAWHDHAVAFRVRILCWFLELYRRRPDADERLVRLLVASIYQHGVYLADDTTHGPRSNHALEAAGSLLSVCISLSELRTAAEWSELAAQRVAAYVDQALAPDGFSKEQSPRYHFFIVRRLAALVSYLEAVGYPLPEGVRDSLRRAAEVWPWLVRDDGSLPRIGDSNERPIPHWRRSLTEIGGEPPTAAPSSRPNPRADTAALLANAGGIYAVMRGHHPDEPAAVDTHVVYKTGYFRFPHFHHDGLSFVLYALGREWLIDPGPHSYEYERWERRYLCSSSAHNVVEVDGSFDVHPVEVTAITRTLGGDAVTARHHLEHAVHTRTLEHRPPRTLRVHDEVTVSDQQRHAVRQLFHVHPDLEVEVDGERMLRLLAPTGDRCTVTQALPGTWRIVRGQRDPTPLGWYSPRPMTIAPIATCVYELETEDHAELDTL